MLLTNRFAKWLRKTGTPSFIGLGKYRSVESKKKEVKRNQLQNSWRTDIRCLVTRFRQYVHCCTIYWKVIIRSRVRSVRRNSGRRRGHHSNEWGQNPYTTSLKWALISCRCIHITREMPRLSYPPKKIFSTNNVGYTPTCLRFLNTHRIKFQNLWNRVSS